MGKNIASTVQGMDEAYRYGTMDGPPGVAPRHVFTSTVQFAFDVQVNWLAAYSQREKIRIDGFMPDDFIVRKGRLKDADGVLVLWNEFIEYHKNISSDFFELRDDAPDMFDKYYCRHVRSRRKIALVAERDGEIVGYLLGLHAKRPPVFKNTDYGFVSDLAVTKKMRSKGVGRALMDEFEKWAVDRKLDSISLSVLAANKIGQKFYKKQGYKIMTYSERKVLAKNKLTKKRT